MFDLCPNPSLLSTPSSPSSHMYPCVCMVSAGGRLGLVENVTEEVQRLRNRVELLEKVREKNTWTHVQTQAHTNKSHLPWYSPAIAPQDLNRWSLWWYDIKSLLFNLPDQRFFEMPDPHVGSFLNFYGFYETWTFVSWNKQKGETEISYWSIIRSHSFLVYEVSNSLFSCSIPLSPSVQKLQLVLAPFSSFFPLSLDEGVSEKTTLLSHSFQQLDRIDSLSEQIGFLEERLGTCEWPHGDLCL